MKLLSNIGLFLYLVTALISKPSDSLDFVAPDTVCYKLKLNPNDTMVYHVMSFDSVIIDFGEPLLKTRYERVRFVCDSVKSQKFYLSATLLHYLGFESSGDVRNVERTENPWLGRKVWFVIDSVGNRYALGYDDSTKAALAPGGAFQPQLFFPFKESCKQIDKTWFVESLDELVENGLPLPLVKQSSLFRAEKPVDTLDEHCNRLNYIKTAQGSYKVESEMDTFRITNIITGYGVYDLSIEKQIPIHYFATVEQKLTISVGNEEPKPGMHYIGTYYTLESYKQGKKNSRKK
ncbi:MAG: hypothetical protein V1779_11770 [bacterium]